MYPYEHMIAMECKEVCILGEVQGDGECFLIDESGFFDDLCLCGDDCEQCQDVNENSGRSGERVSGVGGNTLAILFLGSLTAAIEPLQTRR
jgi:hypothetical protein